MSMTITEGRARTFSAADVAKRWPVVLLAVLVFVGVAAAYVATAPRAYAAQQQVIVTGQLANPLRLNLAGSIGTTELVASQVAIIEGDAVRQQTEAELGRDVGEVSASAVNQSTVVVMSVQDGSPEAAEEAMDAYLGVYLGILRDQAAEQSDGPEQGLTQQLLALNRQASDPRVSAADAATLRTQLARVQDDLDQVRAARATGQLLVSPIGPAIADPEPVSPRPVRDVVLAALTGLVVGLAGAAFLASRRPRPTAPEPARPRGHRAAPVPGEKDRIQGPTTASTPASGPAPVSAPVSGPAPASGPASPSASRPSSTSDDRTVLLPGQEGAHRTDRRPAASRTSTRR